MAVIWPAFAQAQTVVENQIVAPLAGRMYTPANTQSPNNFYGTDLGITFKHKGQLRILFGDTTSDGCGTRIGAASPAVPGDPTGDQCTELRGANWFSVSDDASGLICLESAASGPCANGAPLFPNGLAAYFYVGGHGFGGRSEFATSIPWQRAAPPLNFFVDGSNRAAGMSIFRNGTEFVRMGSGATPLAGFSNYPSSTAPVPATAAAFAIVTTNTYVSCSSNAQCAPFVCDLNLGLKPFEDFSVPCVSPLLELGCQRTTGVGLCVDPGSSVHGASPTSEGRRFSVVHRLQVGNSLAPAGNEFPTVYATRDWLTNRFSNSTVATVESFNPSSPGTNDYRPANGLSPMANEKVLIWGRPTFVGNRTAGRDAKLYFAYVNMPAYSGTGDIGWNVQYFKGLSSTGIPQFDSNPTTAVPLKLNSAGTSTTEAWDLVGQMSVSWVPALQKWVMFYGGDSFPDFTNPLLNHTALSAVAGVFGVEDVSRLVYHPYGSISVRFADQPWGPWSAPRDLFPKDLAEHWLQYSLDGARRNPDCTDPARCVHHEAAAGNYVRYGFLYGPNIIDEWTVDQSTPGQPAVDIFWNVSTFDPYQVLLMRTRLRP
jgi:hypothetical protein